VQLIQQFGAITDATTADKEQAIASVIFMTRKSSFHMNNSIITWLDSIL
jgi:hypothetical protein